MGCLINMGVLMHGFSVAFLHPVRAVKLYFSVPVELYNVLSDLKNLAKNPGQKSGQTSSKNVVKILPTSGQHLAKVWPKVRARRQCIKT